MKKLNKFLRHVAEYT